MNAASKTYARDFVVRMIAYVIFIILSRLLLNSVDTSPWRYLIALLPVIPVIFLVLAFRRYLSGIDELQKRIQLQAIGFAAGTTALLTFAYGFPELIDFPRFSTSLTFALMVILWGLDFHPLRGNTDEKPPA
jgi:hypothetical protein